MFLAHAQRAIYLSGKRPIVLSKAKNMEDGQLGSISDISETAAHLVVGCINHSISQPAWL